MEERREERADNTDSRHKIFQALQTFTVTNTLFRDKYPSYCPDLKQELAAIPYTTC